MAADTVHTQVVVVGAGPVGLMLAGELRLGGAEVVVLEEREEPTTESRASTLHARTMEIFDSRGLLGILGSVPGELRGHFAGMPLDLSLPSPYPGQWKVPQTRTEEILREWSLSLGAVLVRGHALRTLTATGHGVEAEAVGKAGTLRVHAEYLVACDGEMSTVRRLVGAAFPGRDMERELIRADVAGIDIPARRFERLDRGLAIAARRADGVTRVMVHEFGSPTRSRAEEPRFSDVVAAWRRVTGEDISGGTPLWVNAFGDAGRHLESYRHGRVLFAGDAAHAQMPIGGQALNLGLQDAVNLGWKLARHVAGTAHEALLDSYHTERHAVGARTLTNIKAQAELLLGGPEVRSLRAVFSELIAKEPVRVRLAGMISGLDARYAPETPGHPLVGAALPHTDLETREGPTSSAVLLRSGRGLLLGLSGDACHAALLEVAAPWAGRVGVVAARAVRGPLRDTGPEAVLVRPDGHVAWAGAIDGNEEASEGGAPAKPLAASLERWFGPAEPTGRSMRRHRPPCQETRTHRRREIMGRLTGKTALVTGSSRGMGRATAARLAQDGALVVVHCNTDEAAAEETVTRVEKDGGRAFAVRAELGVTGDVHELFVAVEQGLKERTGSADLNILVNNAGVMGGIKPEDTTPEQFDRLMAINAKAPFFVIQRALRNMPDGGRIINISSGLTRFANPDEIAYAMTKGAVEQLALHFAKHLGPRQITVNSVAPGITRNDNPVFGIPEAVEQMAQMSAFNRIGEPEDVADVVAFLASDEARWITGSFVDASGGTLLG
jgi:NAD(P)-dependent dehydrogenase (short-subunit alcohol dehydrogenase family)/2-polyprenyl-6-methoxyphenol hydroxylase-like FAD-dependent oxidoreductase